MNLSDTGALRRSLPPQSIHTSQPERQERVKALLDRWAEWMETEGTVARGYARQCAGAPDARIHSFDDMEIEVNKRIVRTVNTAIWELPVLQREAVMLHYGLQTVRAWKADFDAQFLIALDALFDALKSRLVC